MKKGTCPICGEWGELDQRTLKDGSEIYSCLLCYKDRNGKIEEEHRKTQNSRSKRLEFVEDRLKEYEEFERWKQLEKEQKELDDL
jgi:ribosome-binding protein aMBF1 (putative translation factor)